MNSRPVEPTQFFQTPTRTPDAQGIFTPLQLPTPKPSIERKPDLPYLKNRAIQTHRQDFRPIQQPGRSDQRRPPIQPQRVSVHSSHGSASAKNTSQIKK